MSRSVSCKLVITLKSVIKLSFLTINQQALMLSVVQKNFFFFCKNNDFYEAALKGRFILTTSGKLLVKKTRKNRAKIWLKMSILKYFQEVNYRVNSFFLAKNTEKSVKNYQKIYLHHVAQPAGNLKPEVKRLVFNFKSKASKSN